MVCSALVLWSLFSPEILLVLIPVALWWGFVLFALVDALRVPTDADYRTGSKVIWVLVILLGQGLGALLYLILGRPRRA